MKGPLFRYVAEYQYSDGSKKLVGFMTNSDNNAVKKTMRTLKWSRELSAQRRQAGKETKPFPVLLLRLMKVTDVLSQ